MKINVLCYTYKIYNSRYSTDMINKQCNAGDPLETPGGVYRGPQYKICALCEIVNQVSCSIAIMSSYYSSKHGVSSVLSVGFNYMLYQK